MVACKRFCNAMRSARVLHAQLGVEIRKRLVHEERLRLADDRAAKRDPLPLTTGQLSRLAIEQRVQAERLRRFERESTALLARHSAALQRELDVPPHRHVRIQRVRLEHHRDVAVLGFDVVHDLLADRDRALCRFLEPRDHAQRSRLATARRSEQDEEPAVADLQGEIVYRHDVAESFGDVVERDSSHAKRREPTSETGEELGHPATDDRSVERPRQ